MRLAPAALGVSVGPSSGQVAADSGGLDDSSRHHAQQHYGLQHTGLAKASLTLVLQHSPKRALLQKGARARVAPMKHGPGIVQQHATIAGSHAT